MYKILDDVRRDAVQKCRPTGEEDNKILADAAVLILKLSIYAHYEGLLALEEQASKRTVDDFLRRIIMHVVDGCDPLLVAEIGSNEYWTRDPQGIQAMVLYIYLWGAYRIQSGADMMELSIAIHTLLPESCHPQLDREMAILEEKRELLEKEEQERHLKWEKKEKLAEEILKDYLYGPPVFTGQELLENVHALEEQIEKLPDTFLEKVLHEMWEEKYHCFYVFNGKIRQRIRKLKDNFIQVYRESLGYREYTEAQKLEEEEILGAILVMSGIIRRLSKQEKWREE